MRSSLTDFYVNVFDIDYVSPTPPRLALRGCIHCRAVLYIGDSIPLCGPCYLHLVNSGPLILPVPADHITYWEGK